MTDQPTPSNMQIEFPDEGIVAGVNVEQLGNGLYRLLDHPTVAESTKFGDIIRAEVLSENMLKFVEVVESSEYNVFEFLLPKHVSESKALEDLCREIWNRGVYWQRDFGGLFVFCVPKHLIIDIETKIRELYE